MKNPFGLLLAALGLLLSWPALAQYGPHGGQSCCHCCCHRRDTTALTELTNRVAWLVGPTLLLDAGNAAHAGFDTEIGAAVAPRLTVTAHLMASANRSSANNFGTEATAPAYSLHALTGRVRYQLLNGRHWRVEALAGLGAGAVQVVDRDQQVYYNTGKSSGYRAATVAFRVQPLAEVGLSGSWKLKRDLWLTSQATYARPAAGGGLGPAHDFAYYNLAVAATVPWGYLGARR